jgi:Holliday junction resolvase
MNPGDISKLAFLLYPYIVKSGPAGSSVESLAARAKAIQKGLLPEDEFAATVCWLGNCGGIHRLSQGSMPFLALKERMQAPDFLAFPIVKDRAFPVLIEVKSRHERALDWSEKYLSSLRRFSDTVNLPLLVAWKCGDLWTLVDIQHFQPNVTAYRLTLEHALTEDLLCVLFRNLRIRLNADLELIIDMEILDEVPGDPSGLLPEATYSMKITNAGFSVGGNAVHDARLGMLFLAAGDEVEFSRTGKQACRQIFRPLPDHSFSLSNVLVAWQSLRTKEGPIDWHHVLNAEVFPSAAQEFRDWLPTAISNRFVQYVFDIVPNTWPSFLPR